MLAALALALASASSQAGEVRVAVGALTLAPGLDFHFTYRAEAHFGADADPRLFIFSSA